MDSSNFNRTFEIEQPTNVICDNFSNNYSNGLRNNYIYVNSSGSDDNGNGSYDNPYLTIGRALNNASNGSTIYLIEGIFNGSLNTGLTIDKTITISGLSDNVVIDGVNKNDFFYIRSNGVLTLYNLNFINGYSDVYGQYSVIKNQGNLIINRTSFKKLSTFMGAIFNEGNLWIYNASVSSVSTSHYGEFITNLENCSIANSIIASSLYNNKNMHITKSTINSLTSDIKYVNNTITDFIEDSKLAGLLISHSDITIKNTTFKSGNSYITYSFSNSNVSLDKASFYYNGYGGLIIANSNFTAISSLFNNYVSTSNSNINITYSVILGPISGSYGYTIYAPYNWWGTNKGPNIRYAKYSADYWIVMTFTCDENPISVGTNSKFNINLNKYTDGVSLNNLNNPDLLPIRYFNLEAQNGYFSQSNGYLSNGTFSTYLNNNNESTVVYAIVDSQRMRLIIGSGLTNYKWYVSPTGHDGFGDGSYDNPYKTLSHTISKALTGNTIYLFNGTYTNNWNSNLKIVKNLTLVGLGNVILSRENDRNIFQIKEWGILTIDNINFTVNLLQYSDPLFVLHGGFLTIKNSNFYNIRTYGLVYTDSGVHTNGQTNIYNVTFKNICGPVLRGTSTFVVDGSLFESCTAFYYIKGMEAYNACIPISASINITSTVFTKNSVGAININPITYSGYSLLSQNLADSNVYSSYYANVVNCSFIENDFDGSNYYSSNGVGLSLISSWEGNYYGFIDNCTFLKNKGPLVKTNKINNTKFIQNTEIATISANLINNSYFFKNVNLHRNYDGSYKGGGIVYGTETVLNSTFIGNKAAYGGAISNSKHVHYCVFINNLAKYQGNDLFSYSGNVDYSSNWWGTNQKPDSKRIYLFLGTLTLDNWVIMTLNYEGNNTIKAGLNALVDNNKNIVSLNVTIPTREVYFTSDFGIVTPNKTNLVNNEALGYLIKNATSEDFNVYCTIDGQILDLTIYNNNTQLLMENVAFYGQNNKYNVTLINVNGHKIFNQTLTVTITDSKGNNKSFTLITNDNGYAEFKVDYPIGLYTVFISYGGNGYFEPCNNNKHINILISITYLTSYNYTFYGKNNNFYAVLTDVNGWGIVNQTINFMIINSKGQSKITQVITNLQGRADVILNLDVGKYTIKCSYSGNDWYDSSSSESIVIIRPVNSTLFVPTVNLYGIGNIYNITLKDAYGTLIKGETVYATITQGNLSDKFTLKTDDYGVASLTINYLPGEYKITVNYLGDEVYGSAYNEGIITVEKVYTTLSGFYHVTIPLNGVYTVVLTDMFGRRVAGENITLSLYKGTLLKTYTGISDGNGEVNFIIDVGEGTYLATVDYNGSVWYYDSTSAATIVVSYDVILAQVKINATDFVQYYGENHYFVISFYDPNAFSLYGKTITATISSHTWSQSYNLITDVFGFARLQISLNPGIYNISYKYVNSYYGLFATGNNSIVVYSMPSYISASNVIMNKGDSKYYEITLRDINNVAIKNLQVVIDINGTKYNCTTNNEGIARLLLNLDVGKYDVSYSFDNPNYISSKGSSIILVVDSNKTSTKLSGDNINGLDNQSLNFTLLLADLINVGIGSSEILLNISTIDGEFIGSYTTNTNAKGVAIFKLNLDYGYYVAYAYYKGSNIYLASYSINYINIVSSSNKTKTVLFSGDSSLNYGEKYFVVLSDVNGSLIANQSITFTVNSKTYIANTNHEGKAYLNIALGVGLYNIKASYLGCYKYIKSSFSSVVTVSGNLTRLYSYDITKFYKNGTQYYVQLLDNNNKPLINKTVSITVVGVTYNRTTDSNGWARLNINLNPGTYEILSAYYDSSSNYNSFIKTNFTVLSTIEGNNLVKFYKNESQFYVKVLDGSGNLLTNKNITFNIYGMFYTREINANGVARLNINLNPGTYIITAKNPVDGLERSYNITVLTTVKGNNIVKYYRNGTQYYVKVLDGSGNPLVNRNVSFNIYGVFYTRLTNSNGVARLNINLHPGEYIITVSHPVTGLMSSNTIKVIPTLEGSNLTMNYKDGSQFLVRLVDGQGKALIGKTITMNIYGVFYNKLTDENGIARLNINLMAGKYIITSIYDGYSTSNKITVNSLN